MDQQVQVQVLLQALSTMYSNATNQTKHQANNYLEQFRLSQEAWTISFMILEDESNTYDIQTKLFAAQTLKSKINYNIGQVPKENFGQMKDSLVKLILSYTVKNIKIIRTQLNISLVNLAMQYMDWSNPVKDLIGIFEAQSSQNSEYTNSYLASLLEFLKIVPEECSDVNKTPLTDKEFNDRTRVLIIKNKGKIFQLLIELSRAEDNQVSAAVLDCLNSWIQEIPITKILATSALSQLIFKNLLNDQNFELAIEALISVIKETRDIENLDIISNLYQELVKLKPLLFEHFDNFEVVNGLSRLFVEIGESWNAQIIKNPEFFKDLFEIILKCCEYEDDLDVIRSTFVFWDMSVALLTSPAYNENRKLLNPVFLKLIEIIIDQLKYPVLEDENLNTDVPTKDLFDGDLESKEKFVEFRYEMGDVLKGCCVIVGATDSLAIPYNIVQKLAQGDNTHLRWQDIESPLFSMRSMAREINIEDVNIMLENIFQLLLSLINNNAPMIHYNRIKYATTLVFGRYTQYTAKHSNLLEPQLEFIFNNIFNLISKASLSETEKELLLASSNSFMYFCQDCSILLIPSLSNIFEFFNQVKDNKIIDKISLYEIADGISHIIASQSTDDESYNSIKIFVEPILNQLNLYNENSLEIIKQNNDDLFKIIADKIELVTVLLKFLEPKDYSSNTNKIADLIIEIFPIFQSLFNNFKQNFKVSERIIKYIKTQISNHTTFLIPILQDIISLVSEGYKETKYGCYLWITGAIIRDFDDEYISENLKNGVFEFGKVQANLFLDWLFNVELVNMNFIIFLNNDKSSINLEVYNNEKLEIINKLILIEDKIEDYFRMMADLIGSFPIKMIEELSIKGNESLINHSFQVAILSLMLDKYDVVIGAIRFLVDLIAWGNESPPISTIGKTPIEVRETICKYLLTNPINNSTNDSMNNNGLILFNNCLKGLLFNFPHDAEYEAYDLINKLCKLIFNVSQNDIELIKSWVNFAVNDLPSNTVDAPEKAKTLHEVETALNINNFRRFRGALKYFIGYYHRKNNNDKK